MLSVMFPFILLAILRFFDGAWSLPLKFYPVLVNLVFLAVFGLSLRRSETQVFRFAVLADSSILNSPNRHEIEEYCRKVTLLWCAFFIANAFVAGFTAVFMENWIWALYNGFIVYILMGILFAGEFLARKRFQRKLG
ncbi:MAG: hypothetical protein LBQ87_01420 [Candidatus Fibromonas sp.]|nr:hypothetical protein [Candidatus Fibromonas sp.]